MLIYKSKASLDVKILFSKVAHLLDPEIKKMLLRGLYGNENATFHSGPLFACHWKLISTQLLVSDIEFKFKWQISHGPEWNVKFLFPYEPFGFGRINLKICSADFVPLIEAPFTLLHFQMKAESNLSVFALRSHCSAVKPELFENVNENA